MDLLTAVEVLFKWNATGAWWGGIDSCQPLALCMVDARAATPLRALGDQSAAATCAGLLPAPFEPLDETAGRRPCPHLTSPMFAQADSNGGGWRERPVDLSQV
jgi:hypothetical protein